MGMLTVAFSFVMNPELFISGLANIDSMSSLLKDNNNIGFILIYVSCHCWIA